MYYSKRFCRKCAVRFRDKFPEQLQQVQHTPHAQTPSGSLLSPSTWTQHGRTVILHDVGGARDRTRDCSLTMVYDVGWVRARYCNTWLK